MDPSKTSIPSGSVAADPLDRARREWLSGLVDAHVTQPTAESAFALAQGEWRCGEYDAALAHFVMARDGAPEVAATHLGLLRAASMLGCRGIERSALQRALADHPDDPMIALHTALGLVPEDITTARSLLQAFPDNPVCAEFAMGLSVLAGGLSLDAVLAAARKDGDPARLARAQSLQWACAHAAQQGDLVGHPSRVLAKALTETGREDSRDGLVLECGVYFGRSLGIIAHHVQGPVHGFDSFEGLPEAWNASEGAGAYSTAGRRPKMPANVTLHAGWFEHTLPPFLDRHPGNVRLLHVDCDLYRSTRDVLQALAPRLAPGSIVVFDDLLGYPGYEQHELRAFEEFISGHGLAFELLVACLLGREVAVRLVER